MVKKVSLTIVNALCVLVIVCAVSILLSVLLTGSGQAPSILGYSMFRVTTSSMEPTIAADSLIIVRQTEPESLQVGDIISFYSRDPALDGMVNTHRIVEIEQDGDSWLYTTKGDANNVNDQYTTQEEDIVGTVIFISYPLGKLVRLISNPLIFIPVIILPLAIILLLNLWQTISLAKKIAKEEEEIAIREAMEVIRKKKEESKDEESAKQEG
jgi:signal peptidase I